MGISASLAARSSPLETSDASAEPTVKNSPYTEFMAKKTVARPEAVWRNFRRLMCCRRACREARSRIVSATRRWFRVGGGGENSPLDGSCIGIGICGYISPPYRRSKYRNKRLPVFFAPQDDEMNYQPPTIPPQPREILRGSHRS